MRSLLAIVAFLAFLAPVAAQKAPSAPAKPPADVDVGQLMIPGPLGDMTLGDPNAPVTVVEYASMTCPHCGRFHSDTFPTLKSKYIDTGKAYFVFREFPLDNLAFAAIMLARCAGKDHFFDVVDTLFDHQEEWAYVKDPATALQSFLMPFGVSQQDFMNCLGNQDVFTHVAQVAGRGSDVFAVQGTPTFFFNGHRVVGEMSVADLDQVMGWALGNSTAPAPAPGGPSTPL